MILKNISYLSCSLLTLGLLAGGCGESGDPSDDTGASSGDTDSDGSGGTDGGSDATSDGSGGTTGDGSGGTTGDGSGGSTGDSDGTTGDSGGTTGGTGGTTGDSGGSTGGTTGAGPDTTPPMIVSVTPGDGDGGVLEDAVIEIVFSEPMDKASAQAAWQSVDFPANEVTMAWNAAGDTLSVTPNQGILYSYGADPDATEAIEYGFSITTVATDKAGNELDMAEDVTFTSAKHIATNLYPAGKFTGCAGKSGEFLLDFMWVGDTANGEPVKGFASFEPTNLPKGIVGFKEVNLRLEVISEEQTPYDDLGVLSAHDVEFLDWTAAYDVASMGEIASFCAKGDTVCDVDVSTQFADDYDAGADLSQYGFHFKDDTDFDGNADFVAFYTQGVEAPRLEIKYLIP